MDYPDALAYLDEHTNLEANAGWVHGLSLDRMRTIVDVLGDPHRASPVIHVTGTNGKGSVARMASGLVAAHGLSVGTYTSPHLRTLRERISRNLEPISEEDLAGVTGEIASLEALFGVGEPGVERPTWFELMTAVAFSWFAREAVDVSVVEVGLLGRFDATNVVEADVAVVTNIGRDHTDGRGDWELAVADEKAGIICRDSAVVVGEMDPRLVERFAAEGGSSLRVHGDDFGVDSATLALGGHLVDLRTPFGVLEEIFVPFHGAHQVDNALLAIVAVEAFFDRALDRELVQEALGAVELAGRFEVVSRTPLVILDAAHNPDGVEALVDTLTAEFDPAGSVIVVLGVLGGRDLDLMVEALARLPPSRVICTTPPSPRAVAAADLAAAARSKLPGASIDVVEDVATAVRRAIEESPEDGTVVVTGSNYTLGAAYDALQ